MRCYRGLPRDPDVEMQGQTCIAEVKTSSEKKEKKTSTDQVQEWIRTILLVLCVISVAVDPLFFYLPVINEERKCVVLDRRLYIITICLRTVLDSISLVNIIWQCFQCFRDLSNYIDEKARQIQEQNGAPITFGDARSKEKSSYLWSLAIEVLAILPIPQVMIPIIFTKMKGSQSLNVRKVLTIVILLQYVPRALRIYPSWKNAFKPGNTRTSLSKKVIAVKAAFNLLLYIVASHVLGGIWYFLSVERETACWHLACENHIECDRRSSFDCNHGFGNYTFLNNSCPIETPNTTVFDFGIYQGALQSGIVASMDFPQKTLYCFWWGLRNLSSFGSNLQTSTHFWENCFSVLTSILGLLLFMYFLGHLQMYMQWEASRQLDEAKKFEEKEKQRKSYMEIRKRKIGKWIDRNPRLEEKRELIMSVVIRMFEENKYIDAENPLPRLPMFTRIEILRHLCVPLLQKVPLLQGASEYVLKMICNFLKPVSYNENSYIAREGEPLDALLFITEGIVWTYTTRPDDRQTGCLTTETFFGDEVLREWVFKHSISLPDRSKIHFSMDLPFSTRTLRCHTKVKAFALTTGSMEHMLDQRWWKFFEFRGNGTDSNLEQLARFAASIVQIAFRQRRNARQIRSDRKAKKVARCWPRLCNTTSAST